MAFDFPNTPVIGQLYPLTPAPGIPQYRWDGEKWTLLFTTAPGGGDGTAAGTSFAPAGNISANTVQAAIVELDNEKYAKTGGLLTGSVDILTPSPYISMVKVVGSTNSNQIGGGVGSLPNWSDYKARWTLLLGDNTLEPGANAGSDFVVARYNDAGTFVDKPISVNRQSGHVTLPNNTGIGNGAVGGTTLNVNKIITGASTSDAIRSSGQIQNDVTAGANYFFSNASTLASSFTLASLWHYQALQGTFGAGSTVVSQYGFYVAASLISAVNNYGFHGNIPAGTNRWNVYMAGTANNYMAGALGIGATALSDRSLAVTKNMTGATTAYSIIVNGIVQSDVTAVATNYQSTAGTATAAFTLSTLIHYNASQGVFGAGSSVSAQRGFAVDATLTSATNNFGFWGAVVAGANNWNVYMGGTARNHMLGALSIGGTADPGTGGLHVSGAANFLTIPTTITATAGDNTTKVATTAFVTGAVSAAGGVTPSNLNPLADGTAAPGTSALYARTDHVHPTDTTLAPKASPGLTGTPTAPTATAGTSTTQIATTAFVGTAVAAVTVPSPATVNPLASGTAAVGISTKYAREDHVHPAAGSTAASSVTFTPAGTIAATDVQAALVELDVEKYSGNTNLGITKSGPTITLNKSVTGGDFATIYGQRNAVNRWAINLGDSTTESGSQTGSHLNFYRYNDAGGLVDVPLQISRTTGMVSVVYDPGAPMDVATKGYVDKGNRVVQTISGSAITLASSDAGTVMLMSNASAQTLTIPPNSTVAWPAGTQIEIAQTGAGQVSIAPGAGVTLNSDTSKRKIAVQYGGATLIRTASDVWLLLGNLAA